MSESESQTIQEAFEYLKEGVCQDAVGPDVPVALNIISTMLSGTFQAQVAFPHQGPEDAIKNALYLQYLVGSSSDGADFFNKLHPELQALDDQCTVLAYIDS